MKIADVYTARDQRQDAARWLRRAIEIDPYSIEIHRRLGQLMMRANRFGEAVNEFDVLVRIEPGESAHHSQLAFALHRAGRTDEARRAAKRAVSIDPDDEAQKLLD
jgi:Flp pilus assembly protein TadD